MNAIALQLQDRIAEKLERESDENFCNAIRTWWDLHSSKGSLELVYLYTLREAIEDLQGKAADEFDYEEGIVRENRGDIFDHLRYLHQQTTDRILHAETRARGQASPAIAPLVTEVVYGPDPYSRDPNDRVYRGDPLRRVKPWLP